MDLSHYNQYRQDSPMEWNGLQSNRFPRPRKMLPHNDTIRLGMHDFNKD
jgi:hypothetical protein